MLDREDGLFAALLLDAIPEETLPRLGRRLRDPLDWNYLLDRIRSHQAAPIVLHNLKRYDLLGLVGESVRNDLKRISLEALPANLSYYEELKTLLKAFGSEGIGIVVIKGAALGPAAYANSTLRLFSDIDILVERRNMAGADRVMRESGYMLSEEYRPVEYFDRYHFHHIYIRKTTYLDHVIEVHWDLFTPTLVRDVDLNSIWENRIAIRMDDMDMYTLDWTDHFLYLCGVHCAHDSFRNVVHLCDLIRVARKIGADSWGEVERKARSWGVEKAVTCCALLLKDIFGVALPFPAGSYWGKSQEALLNSVLTRNAIFRQRIHTSKTAGKLINLTLFNQDRRRFVWSHLFPGEKELSIYYYRIPDRISLIRRFRFFLHGVRTLWQLGWLFLGVQMTDLGKRIRGLYSE